MQVIGEVFDALKALSQLCLSADASGLSTEMISVTQSQGKLIHRVLKKYPRIFAGADGSKISGLLSYVLDRLIEGLQLSPEKQRCSLP